MDPSRLKGIDVFSGLSDEDLDWLASQADEASYAAGQALIKKGRWSYEMAAIEEGTVDVMRGDEKVASLEAGDVVGETGVLGRALHNADVVASGPVRAIVFTHWDVKKIRSRLPEVADKLEQLKEQRSS